MLKISYVKMDLQLGVCKLMLSDHFLIFFSTLQVFYIRFFSFLIIMFSQLITCASNYTSPSYWIVERTERSYL